MRKIDATHWRGRLPGSLLFMFFPRGINTLGDDFFSEESWGSAVRRNVLTAEIAGVVWFLILMVWPSLGKPGQESGRPRV